LLTGGSGGHLYLAGKEWMGDLVLEGRFREAYNGFRSQVQQKGLFNPQNIEHLRSLIRVLFRRFAPWMIKLHRLKIKYHTWLSTKTARIIINSEKVHPLLERYTTLLGPMAAHNYSSSEPHFASRYNLELRHPYRDRRLVEFVIGIPAYLLYSNGLYKNILRLAMLGILPESVRLRTEPTSLLSLYLRGLEHEKNIWQDNLFKKNHSWHRYVTQEWLPKDWNAFVSLARKNDLRMLLAYSCVSFEAWYNSLFLSNNIS